MKNRILKSTAYVMAAIFIICGCALDFGSRIPFIACAVSLAWLAVFAYANRERLEKYSQGHKPKTGVIPTNHRKAG